MSFTACSILFPYSRNACSLPGLTFAMTETVTRGVFGKTGPNVLARDLKICSFGMAIAAGVIQSGCSTAFDIFDILCAACGDLASPDNRSSSRQSPNRVIVTIGQEISQGILRPGVAQSLDGAETVPALSPLFVSQRLRGPLFTAPRRLWPRPPQRRMVTKYVKRSSARSLLAAKCVGMACFRDDFAPKLSRHVRLLQRYCQT